MVCFFFQAERQNAHACGPYDFSADLVDCDAEDLAKGHIVGAGLALCV